MPWPTDYLSKNTKSAVVDGAFLSLLQFWGLTSCCTLVYTQGGEVSFLISRQERNNQWFRERQQNRDFVEFGTLFFWFFQTQQNKDVLLRSGIERRGRRVLTSARRKNTGNFLRCHWGDSALFLAASGGGKWWKSCRLKAGGPRPRRSGEPEAPRSLFPLGGKEGGGR